MTKTDLIVAVLRFALNSVFASLTLDPGRDPEDLKSEREAAAAMLAELNPRNAVQAALAARAVTAHHTAMECFRRAALPGVPNTIITRLTASGMALSRMSVQLIKALEQQKGFARPGALVNPNEAVAAVSGAGRAGQPGQCRPGTSASLNGGGGQDPLPSEPLPLMEPARVHPANVPLNRQERRRAAKQAAREARTRDMRQGATNRQGKTAA